MFDTQVFPAIAISFVVTVAFLFGLRPLAFGIGLVDSPGGRKLHVGEVPIVGGIAMFLGVLAGFVALGVIDKMTIGLVFSFFLLVIIGAIDDKYAVPASIRVLVQVSAIMIMVTGSGLTLSSIGNPFGFGEIQLGPFALASTLVVALTVVNAYNLVDGVDGLAGVLGAISLLSVIAVGGANSMSTVMSLVLLSSVLGFLIFNFPVVANRSIRTFMGDAGSTLLGFTIFWGVLGISQGEAAIISPVVGLWFAAIPIFDSLTCVVRRLRAKKSPFKPGRDHFHHTLKRGGFSVQQTLGILAGLQILYASAALVSFYIGLPDYAVFAAWCFTGLSQRWVISSISKRHRKHMLEMYRAGKLGPYRAARARSLR